LPSRLGGGTGHPLTDVGKFQAERGLGGAPMVGKGLTLAKDRLRIAHVFVARIKGTLLQKL